MNFYEAEAFINAWGHNEGEWFVVAVHGNGSCELAKSPAAPALGEAMPSELVYPGGETSERFYPGDLVRTRA